jgi:hypothetical protein
VSQRVAPGREREREKRERQRCQKVGTRQREGEREGEASQRVAPGKWHATARECVRVCLRVRVYV